MAPHTRGDAGEHARGDAGEHASGFLSTTWPASLAAPSARRQLEKDGSCAPSAPWRSQVVRWSAGSRVCADARAAQRRGVKTLPAPSLATSPDPLPADVEVDIVELLAELRAGLSTAARRTAGLAENANAPGFRPEAFAPPKLRSRIARVAHRQERLRPLTLRASKATLFRVPSVGGARRATAAPGHADWLSEDRHVLGAHGALSRPRARARAR